MCVMEEGLDKNFHSLKFWVNLFLLANLLLMSSQGVCYRKGSGQNSHSLEVFFNLFSVANWEEWVKVTQLCLTLCDPVDYTVHWILQARILEWISFPFSRASSQPRDWTQVFHITGRFFTSWATREAREVHSTPFKLVKWVLSCSLLMSMSEAFSVTFTLNKIYTKFWVIETVFGLQVKFSPSETTNVSVLFTAHH